MRVNDDYPRVNVMAQLHNPESVFNYWKRCLEFRKEHKDVFVYGGFETLDPENKDVVAFRRFTDHESWLTVTNSTGKYLKWSGIGDLKVTNWVIGNYPLEMRDEHKSGIIKLKPWEGIIGELSRGKVE